MPPRAQRLQVNPPHAFLDVPRRILSRVVTPSGETGPQLNHRKAQSARITGVGGDVTNIEKAMKDLQDTLVVISEMERRQSALLREHSERIVLIEEDNIKHLERMKNIERFHERTEQNLAEITDKFNGLIGYIAGMNPPHQQPNSNQNHRDTQPLPHRHPKG